MNFQFWKRPMRRKKSTLVILIVALLASISGFFAFDHILDAYYAPDRSGPQPGTLSIGESPGVTRLTTCAFALRTHDVKFDAETMHFRITERATGKVVFENEPGRSFLTVSYGPWRVSESRGLFKLKERAYKNVPDQELASIELWHGKVHVYSFLIGSKTAAGCGLEIEETDKGALRLTVNFTPIHGFDYSWQVQLHARSRAEERFMGFGEQFSMFDLKGERVPIMVSEQGIGRGLQPVTFVADLLAGAGGDWSTTYAPLPISLTTDLRRFQFDSMPYAECDLRNPNVAVFKSYLTGSMQIDIDHADSPAALLKQARLRNEGMPPLPDWIISGAVVGMQGGTARVREEFAALKALDVPMAAFWLQDWCGQRKTSFGKQLWWNWELDRERYPEWEAMRDELAANGTRIMTYVNPFLVDIEGKTGHSRNLFREARDLGYLASDRSGEPFLIPNTDFSAGMLDLTRPEVGDWMVEVLRQQVIGVGASGWMADFGESLPWDVTSSRGASGWGEGPAHNVYPELWAETNEKACADNPDLVYFMRSASAGSVPKTRLFWLGDQLVTWDEHDGMKTAVTGLLSSGLSGMVFNHSDIGGYTTISSPIRDYHRSKEMLMRWMEMNAFTVVFRTHEGNDPEKNAQFYTDDETMAHFARFAKVYAAWFPYRKELVREGSELGLPVVRHLWIHYWTDPEVLKIVYQQFMVGSELMVAPVLDPGVTKVRVYLPAGRWVHLWTDQVYGGSVGEYIEADAPMGYPAVFYKEGSPQGIAFRDVLDAKGLRTGYPAK